MCAKRQTRVDCMCVCAMSMYYTQGFNQSDGKIVKFPLNYHYNLYLLYIHFTEFIFYSIDYVVKH